MNEENDLKKQVESLKALNGELCAEVNAKDTLIHGLFADLNSVAPDLARVWAQAHPEMKGAE